MENDLSTAMDAMVEILKNAGFISTVADGTINAQKISIRLSRGSVFELEKIMSIKGIIESSFLKSVRVRVTGVCVLIELNRT